VAKVFSHIRKFAKIIFTVLLLAWLIFYAQENFSDIYDKLLTADVSFLLLATLTTTIHIILIFEAWRFSLTLFNENLQPLKLSHIFTLSSLAKYVPGGIWQTGGRIYALLQEKVNLRAIVLSLLFETGISTLLCFALALLFLTQQMNIISQYMPIHLPSWLYTILGAAILIFLYTPAIYNKANTLKSNAIPEDTTPFSANFQSIFYLVSLHLVSLLFYCGTYYFCLQAFAPEVSIEFLSIISLIMLATFTGFIAFFAPAGIGIREGLLYIGLIQYLDNDIAITVVLIPRIVIFCTEIIGALFVYALFSFGNRRNEIK